MELSDLEYAGQKARNNPCYVAWAQALLRATMSKRGGPYYDGPCDGVCTGEFVQAIARMQIDRGISIDPELPGWKQELLRASNERLEPLGLVQGRRSQTYAAILESAPESHRNLVPLVGGECPFFADSLPQHADEGFLGVKWIGSDGTIVADDATLSQLAVYHPVSADALRATFPSHVLPAATTTRAQAQEYAPPTIINPISGGRLRNDRRGRGVFGAFRDRGTKKKSKPGTHEGLDILAAPGTAVRSPVDGRVTEIKSMGDGVQRMTIVGTGIHASMEARLFYIARPAVATGAKVASGQHVAEVANVVPRYHWPPKPDVTNHLHFEVIWNGGHIDPGTVIEGWRR